MQAPQDLPGLFGKGKTGGKIKRCLNIKETPAKELCKKEPDNKSSPAVTGLTFFFLVSQYYET